MSPPGIWSKDGTCVWILIERAQVRNAKGEFNKAKGSSCPVISRLLQAMLPRLVVSSVLFRHSVTGSSTLGTFRTIDERAEHEFEYFLATSAD